jgi:cobalt/nickel transport system ATP-binding protein
MPLALDIQHLNFGYPDGSHVLRDVSLEIEEGESIGLIGPNGAGKTTLLLHVNGILRGAGEVRVFARRMCDENLLEIRRDVGLVFQDPDTQLFMPTVFDDVAFGPLNMGWGPEEVNRRVRATLAAVDMGSSIDKPSHHLSFGEKKRVCVATVLAMDPRILVLDEPTSNLDPRHRHQLMGILGGVHVTKLIASHDLDMIRTLTQRVVLLSGGRVVAFGPTRSILADQKLLKDNGFYFFQ